MADVCDVRTVILKCNGPTMFSSQELMRCHKQALTVDAYVQAIWDRRNAPGQAVPYAVAGQDKACFFERPPTIGIEMRKWKSVPTEVEYE